MPGELIPIVLFLCVTAVLILRPITKKLGGLIEAMTRERTPVRVETRMDERTIALIEQLNRRLETIEDRLDFTERLMSPNRELRSAQPQQADVRFGQVAADRIGR